MYILSDIHGELVPIKNFISSTEKYCLQLGDFGFIFDEKETRSESYTLDAMNSELERTDKIIFTILGNHECWPRYFAMDIVTIFKARCWKIRSNIYAVCPGEILNIEGKTFLCVGGADSHDKNWRLDYKRMNKVAIWWKEEAISYEDMANAANNLEKYKSKVDYVCSHTPPRHMCNKIYMDWTRSEDETISEDYLDCLLEYAEFKVWYCGHVHRHYNLSFFDSELIALNIDEVVII